MTENVEKQSDCCEKQLLVARFFFSQRAVFQIMALILCSLYYADGFDHHTLHRSLSAENSEKLIYDLKQNILRVFFIGLLRLQGRLYQTIYGQVWQSTVPVMCAKTFLL
jgi:hypothetical protein